MGDALVIVTMYVRKTTRRYKDKTYTNYLLVESVPTPKGPRQKVVCSLGDLSPRPAREWLELARKVEDALVGQVNLFSDPEVERIVHQVRDSQALHPINRLNPHLTRSTEDLVTVHSDRVTAADTVSRACSRRLPVLEANRDFRLRSLLVKGSARET